MTQPYSGASTTVTNKYCEKQKIVLSQVCGSERTFPGDLNPCKIPCVEKVAYFCTGADVTWSLVFVPQGHTGSCEKCDAMVGVH